jgi:hypothetical protein
MKNFLIPCLFFSSLTMAAATEPLSPLKNYTSSNLRESDAVDVFKKMQSYETKAMSQCYNRAHIWSHEIFELFGFSSKKVLIYYTNKYRKELYDQWGYHIAPVFTVEDQELVFDPTFIEKPITITDWSEKFVEFGRQRLEQKRLELRDNLASAKRKLANLKPNDLFASDRKISLQDKIAKYTKEMKFLQINEKDEAKIKCKPITHIQEFDDHHEEEYCYLQVVSMYYKDPPQLRNLNYEGVERTEFNVTDLESARREAFVGWRSIWKSADELREEEVKRQKEEERRRKKEEKERNRRR